MSEAGETVHFGDDHGMGSVLSAGTSLTWLTPGEVRLQRTPGGALRLERPDRCYLRVAVFRTFPLSHAEQYLSLRSGDEEIGVVRDLAALAPDQQELLREALERRYFRPVVRRILAVTDAGGSYHWDVETDHGRARFTSQHPRRSAARLDDGRWLVTDLDNNRFELPRPDTLDPRSARRLADLLG